MTDVSGWTSLAIAAATLTFGASATAHAAGGEGLFTTSTCVACHGAEGRAPVSPTFPKLAGQNEQYLIAQIMDIRDGRRTNAQAVLMSGVVGGLTDGEVEAIAAYLSALQ